MSPLLAQSGHSNGAAECPLLGVKRTSQLAGGMSANDPKRTSIRPPDPGPAQGVFDRPCHVEIGMPTSLQAQPRANPFQQNSTFLDWQRSGRGGDESELLIG